MSIESVLARGRAAAEARMVDACVIRRTTAKSTNTTTGVVTPTLATIYTGKCEIQQAEAQGRQENSAEAHLLMLQLQLKVPMTAAALERLDEVEITASAHDPELVGRIFRIRDLHHKSHATARRVSIQERT